MSCSPPGPDNPLVPGDHPGKGVPQLPSSHDLIASARGGNASARERLYERFSQPLSRFLRGQVGTRLGRAVSLSDLSQESFVRAFDALDRLPGVDRLEDFEAILMRNARWVVGSNARKHDRFAGESRGDDDLLRDLRDRPNSRSSGNVTRADELRWFTEQVDRLQPDQAEVVRLRMEGRPFDEIARELAITTHAARKRYLRGALELRRFAEGHLAEPGD